MRTFGEGVQSNGSTSAQGIFKEKFTTAQEGGGGLGAKPPAGSRGRALVGGQRGEAP